MVKTTVHHFPVSVDQMLPHVSYLLGDMETVVTKDTIGKSSGFVYVPYDHIDGDPYPHTQREAFVQSDLNAV